jgi:hypothetical protein
MTKSISLAVGGNVGGPTAAANLGLISFDTHARIYRAGTDDQYSD